MRTGVSASRVRLGDPVQMEPATTLFFLSPGIAPGTEPVQAPEESWWNQTAFRWGTVQCLDGSQQTPEQWDAAPCALAPGDDNYFGSVSKGAVAGIAAGTVGVLALAVWWSRRGR